MLCCCFVVEFRLVQFDGCDQQAFSEGLFPHRNAEEFALHELLEFKQLNKFFWNLAESCWFLLMLWTSCNELFNKFLVSGKSVTELCFTVRCSSLLHFFQSSRVFKHLRGVNTFVFFLMCRLKANPSCVSLGEMLDIDDLDPARLPQRKSMNDCVDLVSCSHEADDVWARHNETQDGTMSAMGKILFGIETEHKNNENKNSNSNNVVNEVFLRRVCVPVVPLLINELSSVGVSFQTFRRSILC